MAHLNKVQLIGNVGNDPEVRTIQGGAKTASFSIAVTEKYRDKNNALQENTEWISIVAWNGKAELVEKYIHKGSMLFVEGKLRTRQWEDQQGNKRYSTEVVAENIQILDKKKVNNYTENDTEDLPI